jgi:hypothetical protein
MTTTNETTLVAFNAATLPQVPLTPPFTVAEYLCNEKHNI